MASQRTSVMLPSSDPSTFATRTKPMPSSLHGGEMCNSAAVSDSFVPVCNGITLPLLTGMSISFLESAVIWAVVNEKRQEISITKTMSSLTEATLALPMSCHAISGTGCLVLCSDVLAMPTGFLMGGDWKPVYPELSS